MIRRLLVFFIRRIYQPFSRKFLPPSCRFRPTCSEYTAQAIEKYGVFKGCFLGLIRICKCNPFSKGGDDPLP
ncbi:MAG: membrane protein insertion efficiency factor YidD [Abditibacteriota bacterium]|nr:membrane protein insertion efficiency factor YidD [Abditibacteriota bacterium]